MQIVILDARTANPGDLSFADLEALGEVVVYPYSDPSSVAQRAHTADVVITNKAILDRQVLARLPQLKLISVSATGTNVVDVQAAREHGIVVCNVPGYSTASVAQHTLALLLELTQAVGRHSLGAKAGRWSASQDFSYWEQELVELDGRTFGIVGFGAIGQRVAAIARALGMRILVHTRTPHPAPGIEFTDLDALFARSDVVSLHCPLSEDTRHLVNAERLARMKPGAYLINTSRGPLVDEAALALALERQLIAGAAVDVLSREPPDPQNPLLWAPRCLVTPHIAWATRASRKRLLDVTIENVQAFLRGTPINVVSA
jgi:glycerate dehydrogenase